MKAYTLSQLDKELRKNKKYREVEAAVRKAENKFWRKVKNGDLDKKTFLLHLGTYVIDMDNIE